MSRFATASLTQSANKLGNTMANFIDKLLSGKYPKLESLWTTEFERLVDEVFNRIDLPADLDDEPVDEDSEVEEELASLWTALNEERQRHEATRRELGMVKAELKAAKYKLGAVQAAMSTSFRSEPIG